jgi:hypothetical protein
MDFRRRVTILSALIGLLGVTLVLGAVFSLQTRGLRTTVQQVFPSLQADAVTSISIATPDTAQSSAGSVSESVVELSKNASGQWTVKSGGISFPADESKINSFLSDLARLQTSRTVTRNPALYPDFQLEKSAAHRVTIVSSRGPRLEMYYGKDAVGGGYVRIGNDPAVYLADQSLNYYMTRGADGWDDLRLFPGTLRYSDIQEIDVSFQPGISPQQRGLVKISGKPDPRLPPSVHSTGYRLVRRQTAQSPNTWFYEGDLSITLDQPQVESVAREFANLTGSSFVDPAAASTAGTGVDGPGIQVRAVSGNGSAFTLSIGKSAAKDVFYVRPHGPGVKTDAEGKTFTYRISRWYLERLLKPVDDLEARTGTAAQNGGTAGGN